MQSRAVVVEGRRFASKADFVNSHMAFGRAVREDGVLATGLYLTKLAETAAPTLVTRGALISSDFETLPSGALVVATTLDDERPLVFGKKFWGRVYDELRAGPGA